MAPIGRAELHWGLALGTPVVWVSLETPWYLWFPRGSEVSQRPQSLTLWQPPFAPKFTLTPIPIS